MTESSALNPERERALRSQILAGSRNIEDYRELAGILVAAGREEEACTLLETALGVAQATIDSAAVSAELAWILYGLGQTDRASALAHTALSSAVQPDSPEALMIHGLSTATLGACRYHTDRAASRSASQAAVAAFEKLLATHPRFEDLVLVCRYAAGAYAMLDEHERAIALYARAMERDPSPPNRRYFLLCIGQSLCRLGRYLEGEAHLQEALDLCAAEERLVPRIYFELGRVCRLCQRPEEAIARFEQGVTSLEGNPLLSRNADLLAETKWELGNLYYDARRFGEAIHAFREALPHLPTPYSYFDTLISLGHAYLVTGQYAEARDCYEEVLLSEEASKDEHTTAQDGLSRLPPTAPRRVH